MDEVYVMRVHHALHLDVSGEGAFRILQRQQVEVLRQRAELLEARRCPQQKVFVRPVQFPQRAHHVADVRGEAKLIEPPDIKGDAHPP